MGWGVFWQGEPEFAGDQLGFYLEDLVLEVIILSLLILLLPLPSLHLVAQVAGEDGLELDKLEEGEAGSAAVAAIVYKWQDPKVEQDEKARAYRQVFRHLLSVTLAPPVPLLQVLAFLQMVECVLVGVGATSSLALARLDGLSLPKWVFLVQKLILLLFWIQLFLLVGWVSG